MEEKRKGLYVIDKFGVTGYAENTANGIIVKMKNGIRKEFSTLDELDAYAKEEYYLVGHNVYGNKIDREEITRTIDVIRLKIKKMNDELDALRKQLWVYDNQMTGTYTASSPKTRTQKDLEDLTTKFIAECVRELKPFRSPIVEYLHADSFSTPTTKAAISEDGSHLGINLDMFGERWENRDLYLVICHECRHIWQILAGHVGDYAASDQFADKRKYNEQFAEVDAWAWTCVMCNKRYGAVPDLASLFGQEYWEMIQKRISQIR